MVMLISYWKNAPLMNGKCQNCGEPLDDPILTHCSNKCIFEGYLKSK